MAIWRDNCSPAASDGQTGACLAAKTRPLPVAVAPVVLTIGHSTHPFDEFVDWLRAHGVERVIDVRTVPKSRHNPQYNKDTMPASLEAFGLGYLHMPGLGGLRRVTAASVNSGWRNASFRGYADYMQTPEFAENIDRLIEYARQERIALMCAEAVPWRCHRSLIGDALLVRGIAVEDIMSPTQRKAHGLTAFAKVHGTCLTYPGDDPQGTDGGSGSNASNPPAGKLTD